MKRIFSIIIVLLLVLSCSKDSGRINNPYLPTYRFTSSLINLNLPSYSSLKFAGNAIEYNEVGVGILSKILIINTGAGFFAFDIACPNHTLTNCSSMDLDGIKAKCSCEGFQYSLYSGQAVGAEYPMLQYRVEVINENSIRVYN